jgi:magnesium chelatase family protein
MALSIIRRKNVSVQKGVTKTLSQKISEHLLDRIDLHIKVASVNYEELSKYEVTSESSDDIRERVRNVRKTQEKRFDDLKEINCNAQMPGKMVREVCRLDTTGAMILKKTMEKLQISTCAYDRILKVVRKVSDMDVSVEKHKEHVAQTIQYRQLNREGRLG